jgi:cell division protein FtsQ
MPAVVRGGRRQASEFRQGQTRSNARTVGRRGVSAPVAKLKLGSVAMPSEATAWFAFLALVCLLSVVLFTGGRGETLRGTVVSFVDSRIASLGLNLQNVRLVGVSDVARDDIKKALTFERGQPLALMDLEKIRNQVEAVGWVKSASIRRQFPDKLIIEVVERPRMAVWQYQKKTYVIDDQGMVIPNANFALFQEIPLIMGEGANEQAAAILSLMTSRPELMSRIEALVRVDTRRWDIRLRNNTLIKLPALDQEEALNRLDTLIVQDRILDQGLAEINLLDPNTLVVVPISSS